MVQGENVIPKYIKLCKQSCLFYITSPIKSEIVTKTS